MDPTFSAFSILLSIIHISTCLDLKIRRSTTTSNFTPKKCQVDPAAVSVTMSAWLPPPIVRIAVGFLEHSGLAIAEVFLWSAGFTKEITWRGGDPSWLIQMNLVDCGNWSSEVLAKDLPNSVQSAFVTLTRPRMFQISVEGYNEKHELQDWCYCGSFGVVADGEFELKDNAVKLMSTIYPSSRAMEVVGRFSGGFNSIVMLRVANINDQYYVLRTRKPKPLSQLVFENITITQTVVQELKLPFAVPRLILSDATVNNPVSRQFWLQTRVPGVALSEVIDELNVTQRVCLAREVARCITAIHRTKKFPHCGGFVRHPTTGAAVVGCPLFFERVEGQKFAGYFEYFHFVPGYSPPSNLHAFLKQRFEAVARSSGGPAFKYFWQVAQQKLKEYGQRCSRKNRLVHTDLFPRNILVTLTDGQPHITGVVDWDQVQVLPPELAIVGFNPGWLWSDLSEPPNGFDLQQPATHAEADIVRVAFVEEMERLRPGYVAHVARAQRCDLGVLGGLASWGEDKRGALTPTGFFLAGVALAKAQGLLNENQAASLMK